MRRKLREQLFLSGLMVYEFDYSRDGWPHIHLLVLEDVSEDNIRQRWAKVTAGYPNDERLVDVQEIYDAVKIAVYVAKFKGKLIPKKFDGLGREWGRFGKVSAPIAEVIVAPFQTQQEMIRAMKVQSGHDRYSRSFDTEENGCRIQIPLSESQILKDVYGPEAQAKEFATDPLGYLHRKYCNCLTKRGYSFRLFKRLGFKKRGKERVTLVYGGSEAASRELHREQMRNAIEAYALINQPKVWGIG
jgi:hypothetical protein